MIRWKKWQYYRERFYFKFYFHARVFFKDPFFFWKNTFFILERFFDEEFLTICNLKPKMFVCNFFWIFFCIMNPEPNFLTPLEISSNRKRAKLMIHTWDTHRRAKLFTSGDYVIPEHLTSCSFFSFNFTITEAT